MEPRPALRRDLDVRPVHRSGRRFIELADPRTGVRLWLSDLGYSVAFLMEGEDLDEVIRKARAALHIELSKPRLVKFAERLAGYGLLVGGATDVHAAVAAVAVAQSSTMMDPPAAALAAAAIVPPAVPVVRLADPSTTLALSPREMAMLLRDAKDRGAARTRDLPGPAALFAVPADGETVLPPTEAGLGRRRNRTAHGRVSPARDDLRASSIGVAARRDMTPPMMAAVIRRTRPS